MPMTWRPATGHPTLLGCVTDSDIGVTAAVRFSQPMSAGDTVLTVEVGGPAGTHCDVGYHLFFALVSMGVAASPMLAADCADGPCIGCRLALPGGHRAMAYMTGTSVRVLGYASDSMARVIERGLSALLGQHLRGIASLGVAA